MGGRCRWELTRGLHTVNRHCRPAGPPPFATRHTHTGSWPANCAWICIRSSTLTALWVIKHVLEYWGTFCSDAVYRDTAGHVGRWGAGSYSTEAELSMSGAYQCVPQFWKSISTQQLEKKIWTRVSCVVFWTCGIQSSDLAKCSKNNTNQNDNRTHTFNSRHRFRDTFEPKNER